MNGFGDRSAQPPRRLEPDCNGWLVLALLRLNGYMRLDNDGNDQQTRCIYMWHQLDGRREAQGTARSPWNFQVEFWQSSKRASQQLRHVSTQAVPGMQLTYGLSWSPDPEMDVAIDGRNREARTKQILIDWFGIWKLHQFGIKKPINRAEEMSWVTPKGMDNTSVGDKTINIFKAKLDTASTREIHEYFKKIKYILSLQYWLAQRRMKIQYPAIWLQSNKCANIYDESQYQRYASVETQTTTKPTTKRSDCKGAVYLKIWHFDWYAWTALSRYRYTKIQNKAKWKNQWGAWQSM